jgi:sugar lactone lactonase YvrE
MNPRHVLRQAVANFRMAFYFFRERDAMNNQPRAFIPATSIGFVGRDLNRPECVLSLGDGSLLVSHRGGGAMRIGADGAQALIGRSGLLANGHEIVPNGIALLPDGDLLLANIGEGGGVWRLTPGGELLPFLMEADGVFLDAANFVMRDDLGRIWITVSTVAQPRFKAYSSDVADGLIVLVDDKGARVLADDIAFANECRIGPDGQSLYISETFGRRVTRYRLAADGTLSGRETFASFGRGDFPDGCRFDASGHLWLTCIVGNRIYRIAPSGEPTLVVEDSTPEHIAWVESAVAAGMMGRQHFYETGGSRLGNIASIAFSLDGGRAYCGSLCGTSIATFAIPDSLRGHAA